MSDLFVYGTLCHLPLRRAVIGRGPPCRPARLRGFGIRLAAGRDRPMLVRPGEGAEGLLLTGLSEHEIARVAFYEEVFGFMPLTLEIDAGGEGRGALAFVAPPGTEAKGGWSLADWAPRWGGTAAEAAADLLRDFGRKPAAEAARRYTQLLIRGGARVRAAAETRPTDLRRHAAADDVLVDALRVPYAEYFSVEEADLRFRRFDGRMSGPLTRAVFVSGDAAVVLPYDPGRDRVLVIEQFRAGPSARGDSQPWLIEAVAGRVDGGESPEDAALREAREEAGISIDRLIPASRYYPSPAAKGEYIYSYIGIAALPDGSAGIGGVPGEGEDIRAHLVDFDRLMQLVETGEVDNAPLIILALRLRDMRPGLRRRAAPPGLEVGPARP